MRINPRNPEVIRPCQSYIDMLRDLVTKIKDLLLLTADHDRTGALWPHNHGNISSEAGKPYMLCLWLEDFDS